MNKAERSIVGFAVYLLAIGTALMLDPNLLLKLMLQPQTSEVWIRVAGLLAAVLGIYYIVAALNHYHALILATVAVRLSVIVVFGAFVIYADAPWIILLFGAIDAAAAIWTWKSIQADKRAAMGKAITE